MLDDMDAMAGFQVPALLFGPVGKDAHQMSERVNARSLLEEVPGILQYFIEQVFCKWNANVIYLRKIL
mgnify:CR=1 FL=1